MEHLYFEIYYLHRDHDLPVTGTFKLGPTANINCIYRCRTTFADGYGATCGHLLVGRVIIPITSSDLPRIINVENLSSREKFRNFVLVN